MSALLIDEGTRGCESSTRCLNRFSLLVVTVSFSKTLAASLILIAVLCIASKFNIILAEMLPFRGINQYSEEELVVLGGGKDEFVPSFLKPSIEFEDSFP